MSNKENPNNLSETELEDVQGGVGLLLPAVQAARESAKLKARSSDEFRTRTEARPQKAR